MNLKIVAIRDRALDAYGRPIFVHTVGQAIRSFQDEINRAEANNEMNKHPDDYDLYLLGDYDDSTGKITNVTDGPQQIAIGKNLKQP